MRHWALVVTASALVGAAIGSAAALRWILVVLAAGGPQTALGGALRDNVTAAAVSMLAMILVAWRLLSAVWKPQGISLVVGGISFLSGCASYAVLHTVFIAVAAVHPEYVIRVIAAGVVVGIIGALAARRRLMLGGLIVAASFVSHAHSAAALSGDQLVIASLRCGPPLSPDHYLALAASVGLLGSLVGWSAALITRTDELRAAALGCAAGIGVAAFTAAAQTVTYLVAMGSGQDPVSILSATVIVWTVLGASVGAAGQAYFSPGPKRLVRLAPLLVLFSVAEYAFIAGYGYCDYKALERLNPDTVYTYVHFSDQGTWRRTVDHSANAPRALRAQQFLAAYPYSAYRPAAMLAAAECEFGLWHFDDASRILTRLKAECPVLDGYGGILRALADLAAGTPTTILRTDRESGYFARWQRTQGAQLAAYAAERLGQPVRARGLHSAYIDYLLSRHGASWTSEAVEWNKSRMETIGRALAQSADFRRTGTVQCEVTAGTQPVAGARVVLVQPHHDAALPSDSRQFTGAWSIPAWNGVWGVSDREGLVTIRDVPYGEYEVVLGLDFRTCPRNYVVSSSVPVVKVNGERVRPAPIRLVPAISLVFPASGGRVTAAVHLEWEGYPGADRYSVSIMSLGDGRVIRKSARSGQKGSTCWARSGIRPNRTRIDSEHFVNGHCRLQKGGTYMWVVYAYDGDGKLLSSSEHYFDVRERTFVVK